MTLTDAIWFLEQEHRKAETLAAQGSYPAPFAYTAAKARRDALQECLELLRRVNQAEKESPCPTT